MELKVKPLQNQPTLTPGVVSSPTQSLQPPLRVAPTAPTQSISVQRPAPTPEITSIGTATQQQPYDRLKSSIGNLDPIKKQELAAILARGQERGLTQEQMRKVADAYLTQNPNQPAPAQEPEKKGNWFTDIVEGIAKPFANVGVTAYNAIGAPISAAKEALTQNWDGAMDNPEKLKGNLQNVAGAFKETSEKPREIGSLGKVNPLLMRDEEREAKDPYGVREGLRAGGTAIEIASNFIGGSGAGAVGKQFLKGRVLSGLKEGAIYGLAGGATAGFGYGLQNEEATPMSVAIDTLVNGLGGGVFGATIGATAPIIGRALRPGLEKVFPSLKFIRELNDFYAAVDEAYNKGFKPKTPTNLSEKELNKTLDRQRLGVALVLDSLPKDEAGNILDEALPGDLAESLAATNLAKKKIFEIYNQMAIDSGDAGLEINLASIADSLEKLANDPRLDVSPGTADYARRMAETFRNRGSYSPLQAQETLAGLNEALQAFYRNPDPNAIHNSMINNYIAVELRRALNEGISGLDNNIYRDLRIQYGALESMERDIARRQVQAMKLGGQSLVSDFADIASGEEVIRGILTFNPKAIATGFTIKGISRFIKNRRDPNVIARKMFERAAKAFKAARNDVIPPRNFINPKTQKLLPPGTGKVSNNVPINVPPGGFGAAVPSAANSAVGKVGSLPLRRVGGQGSRRTNRLGGIGKSIAGGKNPATNQLYAAMGGVAGVEVDENGNVTFNDSKAALGVAVLLGVRSPAVIDVLKSFSKQAMKKASPQVAEILTKLSQGEMPEKEAIAALKQLSDKVIGGLKRLKDEGGTPNELPKAFQTEGYNVGLTNVAGRGVTQSDEIMGQAKALYDEGKFAEAQIKYNEAVNFGVNKVKEAFEGTGIKVKAKPGFGVFEGTVEPNIDLNITVPKGKEDLFHAKLAEIADENFDQKSTISYRSAAPDSPLGVVDEARQVYNEPIIRFTFKKPATVAEVKELNALMAKNGIVGGSFKDNGRTLDIINLSHYNKDYEQFSKQLQDLSEDLNRNGLLERIQRGVAETRHIGSDSGNAPITYKQVQGEFYRQNPDLKQRGTQASRSLTSKVLDRLPLKDRVSKSQVEQLLKSQDIPAAERELVSSILSKEKDTIKVRDLEYKIRKNLLNTKPEEIDKWADYGMSNLNIRYENPTTIVLRTPVKHGVSGHFGVEDDFGHIRIFEKENYSPKKARHISDKTVYVAEIQADAFQRGLQMEKLSDRIDRYKGALDFTQKRVKELEDDLARNRKTENPERIKELENDLALAKLRANHEEAVFRLLQQREVSHGQTFVDKDVDELLKAADNIYTLESRALTGTSMTENLDFLKERLPLERENFAKLVEAVKRKPDSQEMAKQMIGFEKGNKYRKRMLEETLVTLQDKGYKEINLPTPSTVARVEWGKGAGDNVMPYEVLQGDPDRLDFGDIIDYGGEEMMVIDTPDGGIRVAPKDDVRIYDQGEWADSTVDSYYSEAKYELEAELKTAAKTITPQQAQELIDEGKVSWETEMVLQKVAEGEENLTPENLYDFLDKADDEWRNRAYEDEYDDMQGVFSEIYTEERGGGAGSSTYQRYYAVEDGSHTEVFDSPDNYDTPAGYDPETIDKDKSEAEKLFSKTEMGVLDNYYDLQKNLKEIQKRTDIKVEYVREEDNNGEPLTWIRVIPNKNLKKTAF